MLTIIYNITSLYCPTCACIMCTCLGKYTCHVPYLRNGTARRTTVCAKTMLLRRVHMSINIHQINPIKFNYSSVKYVSVLFGEIEALFSELNPL